MDNLITFYPYFLLSLQLFSLAVLALFGLHRFVLLLRYAQTRTMRTTAPAQQGTLPRVTIQLPLYNEALVVDRLLQAVAAIRYPRELLEIQVLDDSTDHTSAIVRQLAAAINTSGIELHHIRRGSRSGYKGGALAYGLERARGELIAVFDADFVPSPDFLERTVPYFAAPETAMVQVRWSHLNAQSSCLTRAQAVLLDGHFQIEHTARSRSGLFFNFNGTAGIWRKEAIAQAGGWQGDTLTEDLDLSYRAQLRGAKLVYLPDYTAAAELPSQIDAFKSQQFRWAKGSVEVLRKLGKEILKANLPLRIKCEALLHLGANFCYPLMLLVGLLILPGIELHYRLYLEPSLWVQLYRMVLGGAFLSVALFYFVAATATRSCTARSALWQVPLAIVTGLGLSLSNTLAVWEALCGTRSPFVRTAKTGELGAGRRRSSARRPWRQGLLWAEVLLFMYFCVAWQRAFALGQWHLLPLVTLFAAAFGLFSFWGLLQLLERQAALRSCRLAPVPERSPGAPIREPSFAERDPAARAAARR